MPVISDEFIERPTVETDDPAITGSEVKRLYSDYIQEWLATESGRRRQIFEWADKKITTLSRYEENWDSYNAPAPNNISVRNARRVLGLIEVDGLYPTQILPSAEGGIGICFLRNDKYADLECSNDGEILGVYYTGTEMPQVFEADATSNSINAAIHKIREHIIS